MQNQNKKENNTNYLFAPWRMDYIKSPKGRDNVFNLPDSKDYRKRLILLKGNCSFVMMNLYPYNNGHIMVVPIRKVDSIEFLDSNESSEINFLIKESVKILKKGLQAQGFNIGLNIGKAAGAGIDSHLHFHIVPRWVGDKNFMPAVGNTKVISQGLYDTYDELKSYFDQLKIKK